MTDDITIPPEAVTALQDFISERHGSWLTDAEATAAITAALRAWPGMQRRYHIEQAIILPLQEKQDD